MEPREGPSRHIGCNPTQRRFEEGRLGHKAKWEYFRAVYERYRKAEREAKHLMLNEFCLNTGYHRKYAIRLLNRPPPGKQPERRPRGRPPPTRQTVPASLARAREHAAQPWPCRAL